MTWVVQARNYEFPIRNVQSLKEPPVWDTKWYTIPTQAFETGDIDSLARPFEQWHPMEMVPMETCIQGLVYLRANWLKKHGELVAMFRLYNAVTGEVIPAELFPTT